MTCCWDGNSCLCGTWLSPRVQVHLHREFASHPAELSLEDWKFDSLWPMSWSSFSLYLAPQWSAPIRSIRHIRWERLRQKARLFWWNLGIWTLHSVNVGSEICRADVYSILEHSRYPWSSGTMWVYSFRPSFLDSNSDSSRWPFYQRKISDFY